MLMGMVRVSDTLVRTAWYLHSVASSNYALRKYGLQRQRSAFKVAGHVFDLVTKTSELGRADRLKYSFASQIAYVRGELDPNAIAVYNQNIYLQSVQEGALPSDFSEVALSCAVVFLGFDVGYVSTHVTAALNYLATRHFKYSSTRRGERQGLCVNLQWNSM